MRNRLIIAVAFTTLSAFSNDKSLIHHLSMHSIDQVYKSDKVVGIRYKDYKKPLGQHRQYFAIMRDKRKHRSIHFYLASPPEQLLQSANQQRDAMQNSQFQANQIMSQAQEALMQSMLSDSSSDGGSFFGGGAGQALSNDWNNTSETDALLQSFSQNTSNQASLKQFVKTKVNIHYWDKDVVKSGKVWYTITNGLYFFIALDNGFFVTPKLK
ncbi:MAG: hypothetical protein P8L47_01940 [Candidatus Marinamargulisbacteria bacterium]|nr:hypothetical protein [Candidatus Marinamargulisbacteria bacterium]